MVESVAVPKELLRELHEGLLKVEEVLATLEELMDREGLERIRKAKEEYEKGEYATVERSEDIEKMVEE